MLRSAQRALAEKHVTMNLDTERSSPIHKLSRIQKSASVAASTRVPVSWEAIRSEASRRFGITRFRPGQRELIECALSGKDALGVLPTGAGKSLCYQLPSLFLEGAVVVVSPLIALMQDQYEHLADAEIEAARLDSTVPAQKQREREEALAEGHRDIVLVTPERL